MGAVGLAVITLKECLARPPNDFSIRWWSFNNPRIQKKFPAVKFLLDTEKYCKNGLYSFFLDVALRKITALTWNFTWAIQKWFTTPSSKLRLKGVRKVRFDTVKYSKNGQLLALLILKSYFGL